MNYFHKYLYIIILFRINSGKEIVQKYIYKIIYYTLSFCVFPYTQGEKNEYISLYLKKNYKKILEKKSEYFHNPKVDEINSSDEILKDIQF